MSWVAFPVGDMTAAFARDRDSDFYRAVAAIAHVGPRVGKRRIHEAAGNTLLRNLFRDTWPPVNDVGDLTVAAALELDLVDAIAVATYASPEETAATLAGVRGNTLVRNVFGTVWPTHPQHGEEDKPTIEDVGALTVRQACKGWLEDIAEITGLSSAEVRRVLLEANGRTRVSNAFAGHWPKAGSEGGRDSTGSGRGSDSISSRGGSGSAGSPEPPLGGPVEEPDGWEEEVLRSIGARGVKHGRCKAFRVLRDRFELLAKLGQGGFGTAYAARDRMVPNGLIVVKTAPDHSRGYEALVREVMHQQNLQHPNVCRILQIDKDPSTDVPFLTMQYAGVSVEWILEEHGVFPTHFALKVVRGAAQGLHHAHENEIVHRDVSPGNILVDDRGRVRVTDFGVSALGRMTTVATSHRTVVATGNYGYNPSYAAPEVRRGGAVRRAADQYSLARCLCAMLEGESLDEHYGLRRFERLSTRQNDAIKRALSKDAGDRFPSILEFAEAVAG